MPRARGPGSPVGGPPRSPRRERPRRLSGSPPPARPIARPPGRTRRQRATPEAGRAARPSPRRPAGPPAASRAPPPSLAARRPPPWPGTPAAGSHSLVFLGAEDGGQILRHFPPAAAAADTAADADDPSRRPRETSPGRDDSRPTPTAWRRCPIGRDAACAWAGLGARVRHRPRGPGARAPPAWAPVPAPPPGAPSWRSLRSPAALHAPSGHSPALLAPLPRPQDPRRRPPVPREAERANGGQGGGGGGQLLHAVPGAGPGPRLSRAGGFRGFSTGEPPSPRTFPLGPPPSFEPFLREDPSSSTTRRRGAKSGCPAAPGPGGAPPGPGPGKARRVRRASDAQKAGRT